MPAAKSQASLQHADVMSMVISCTDSIVVKASSSRAGGLFVCFVALRPKSTAMVIAGWSVHLTTLFPGQASTSG